MINFDQTLDGVERIHDLLKSAEELDGQVRHAIKNLESLDKMMHRAQEKRFQRPEEVVLYIERVLRPQLNGIADALKSGTEKPLRNIDVAQQHNRRLLQRLQAVAGHTGVDLPL